MFYEENETQKENLYEFDYKKFLEETEETQIIQKKTTFFSSRQN